MSPFARILPVMTDEYLGKMLGNICEIAQADGATLFVVEGEVLRPFLIYRLPIEYILGIGEVRVGEQCCGRAVAHKRPWIVADMLTDPLFAAGRAGAVDSPIRAAFSVPVMHEDAVIASLACHFNRPHSPSPEDIERNQAFAKLLTISLRARYPLVFDQPYFVPEEETPLEIDPASGAIAAA